MRLLAVILFLLVTVQSYADGNKHNDSFNKAKQMLLKQVYIDNKSTIYCNQPFDEYGAVKLPDNFTNKYKSRAGKIEWEHVVPAENFGRAFVEWREGHPDCIDKKGKAFKGRNCAEKVNQEFRYMLADMYNLFPEIGAVNATRQNYDFTVLPNEPSSFNGCIFKVKEGKAEAPERARGVIARTYLYFDDVYQKFNMSSQMRKQMEAWDKMYPTQDWECTRYKRILKLQGNDNKVMAGRCSGN